MRRLGLALLSIILLLSIPAPTHAQAPAVNGLRTITASQGYQFQVPSDWQQVPAASLPGSLEVGVVSPDGKEFVAARTFQNPPGAADLAGTAAAASASLSQGTTALGAVTVLQGPDSIQVIGADAGEALVVSADQDGSSYVASMRTASRDQVVYVFAIYAPADYTSHPNFSAIPNSFKLTIPAFIPDPGSAGFPLSPEEAATALLPYKLSPQDDLAGYTAGPISLAFTPLSEAGQSSLASAAWRASGVVIGFRQTLRPASQPQLSAGAAGSVSISLMSTVNAAHDDATGKTLAPSSGTGEQWDPVQINASPGDSSFAWHVTKTASDGSSLGYYDVRWQRGQIVFAMLTPSLPLGQEQQSDAENLATSIDAAEQARPPLNLGPATVTPPASEAQRFLAAFELRAIFAPASAAPDGYELSGQYFFHPAEDVNASDDPRAKLHKVDEEWKEVASDFQEFTSQQNSKLVFEVSATLSADGASATALAGSLLSSSLPSSSDVTAASIAPPVQLGDAIYLSKETALGANGDPFEVTLLNWTHGALVLSARMYGPPGTTSIDQVVALAQQVEARFQANSLPTRGLLDLVPPPAAPVLPIGPTRQGRAGSGILATIAAQVEEKANRASGE